MVTKKKSKVNCNKIVICVCGFTGSGKSTQAKRLADKYGLKYFSGGDALRALASVEGYNSYVNGWWESPEAIRFLEDRKQNERFDREVDDKLLEYASQGNVVLDSWSMPWLSKGGFKIWLEASLEKRTERIAKRDEMTAEQALKAFTEKEARTKALYKKIYGFAVGEDFTPFDLVLDTDNLSTDEVFEVLCLVVDNVVLSARHQP